MCKPHKANGAKPDSRDKYATEFEYRFNNHLCWDCGGPLDEFGGCIDSTQSPTQGPRP